MEKEKKKLLLIWPPLASTLGLPLGVTSLKAYLSNHGIRDAEMLDANGAYLKENLAYKAKRKYCDRVRKIGRSFWGQVCEGNSGRNGCWEQGKEKGAAAKSLCLKLHSVICRAFNNRFDHFLDKEQKQTPWSLEAIKKKILKNSRSREQKILRDVLKEKMEKNDFDLVGFSVVYPEQLFFSLLMAKIVKEEFRKETRIVFGGPQVAKQCEELKEDEAVLGLVDFLIAGDGEEPLLKLSEAIPRNLFSDVPNLFCRNMRTKKYEKGAKVFRWDARYLSIPEFEGFDLSFYKKSAPLLASKGCIWSQCNFCTYPNMQQHRHSPASPGEVLKVMAQLEEKYGFSNYHFIDDALSPKFLADFSEDLARSGRAVKWSCNATLEREFGDGDFCKKLRRSGMRSVVFGLESISPRILSLMNKSHKNMSRIEIAQVFHTLSMAGIRVGVNIIVGFPTETLSEARETLTFLIDNEDLSATCVQPFCLESGTAIFENPEAFGINRIFKKDKNMTKRVGFRYNVSSGMSRSESERFSRIAVKALKKAGKGAFISDCFFNAFQDKI